MNAEAAVSNITQFAGPKQSFSLAPRDINEAMRLADILANSDLVPKDFRGKPANVLVAVQWGAEIGMQPMQAIQNIAVINGKPSIYGDAGKALLLARGFMIDEDDQKAIKQAGMARCKITRPGHQPCERTFSIENAKTAQLWGKQGPWTNYPERQMAWRAFWFAARDCAADVLKGIGGAEEVMDFNERDITPGFEAGAAAKHLSIWTDIDFAKNLPQWQKVIETRRKTVEELIALATKKFAFTPEQEKQIRAIVPPPETVTTASAEQMQEIVEKASAAIISMEEIGKRFSLAQGSLIPATLVPDILAFIANPIGE